MASLSHAVTNPPAPPEFSLTDSQKNWVKKELKVAGIEMTLGILLLAVMAASLYIWGTAALAYILVGYIVLGGVGLVYHVGKMAKGAVWLVRKLAERYA